MLCFSHIGLTEMNKELIFSTYVVRVVDLRCLSFEVLKRTVNRFIFKDLISLRAICQAFSKEGTKEHD